LRRFSLQLVHTRTPTTQTVHKFVLTAHGSRTRFSLQRGFNPMFVHTRTSTAQTVQEFVLTAHGSRTRKRAGAQTLASATAGTVLQATVYLLDRPATTEVESQVPRVD